MSDKINLKEMEQQANRLLTKDGLMELLMGAILFVTSSSFAGTPIFTPFLGLYVIFLKNIIEGFRKKFTYPRIGYLKLPEEDSKKIGVGILTFMGAIMLALAVVIYLIYGRISGDLVYKWIPLLIGLIFFGGLQYNYSKSGDKVNLVYITIAVGAGLIFSLLDFPSPRDGPLIYMLLMSAMFLVSGIIRFLKFRRDYPLKPLTEGAETDE